MVPTQMMITGAVPIAVRFLIRMENLPSVCVVETQPISIHFDDPNLTFNLDLPLGAEWHVPNAMPTTNPITNNTVH